MKKLVLMFVAIAAISFAQNDSLQGDSLQGDSTATPTDSAAQAK